MNKYHNLLHTYTSMNIRPYIYICLTLYFIFHIITIYIYIYCYVDIFMYVHGYLFIIRAWLSVSCRDRV